MVRKALRFVPWKDKEEVVADLQTIYTTVNAEEAKENLSAFHRKWNEKYPTNADSWERNWEGLIPFFRTQTILEKRFTGPMRLSKISKNRGSFSNDELALKFPVTI